MADMILKDRIKSVLKNGYFRDPADAVFVTDDGDEYVHLAVVSEKLEGKRLREKIDLIWSELTRHLTPEEWSKITLTIGRTPEEIMMY